MPALFCLCMDQVLVELGVEPLQSLGEYSEKPTDV